ncbi:MAG: YlmC/YmxH family sporulation protein [Muribaculaceae bacterium]|nr:YlmC/YmxH family sporulation protein [Alistipes senegalensis]MCM1473998.1 YlmC/YmxH family sporulation protein [Muribaculaceae bacterium]MDE6425280.1 YlmC/YmxH family sporulation protein [Ruminococcus sp.]
MICRLEDLRKKEVIDILTGERLGYIDDVEMNVEKSAVQSFVIYGRERFFGIFGREDDVIIPCSEIKVVGNDVVLIKHTEQLNITKIVNKNPEIS